MADGCVFCAIAQRSAPASIVCENELALAAVDLRQFHPGHHIHIHPRLVGDNVLHVYPQFSWNEERSTLDSYAAILRAHLE
jgi:diadenosine tetraphosphate (Ap4A) HIT family hydrolase